MSKMTPTVSIILDKERLFKLDFKALMSFEKASGKNVLATDVWQQMSATDMVTLLWAGLLHEDAQLTLDKVAEMIHPGNLQEVVEVLQKGFSLAMPGSQDAASGENDSPLATSRPTG